MVSITLSILTLLRIIALAYDLATFLEETNQILLPSPCNWSIIPPLHRLRRYFRRCPDTAGTPSTSWDSGKPGGLDVLGSMLVGPQRAPVRPRSSYSGTVTTSVLAAPWSPRDNRLAFDHLALIFRVGVVLIHAGHKRGRMSCKHRESSRC